MTVPQIPDATRRTPLRLWPGVAAAALLVVVRFGAPLVAADAAILGVLGALALGAVIAVWWLFFSRAPWMERIGAAALMAGGLVLAARFVDPSISGGMMGNMLIVYATPWLAFAIAVWAAVASGWPTGRRALGLVIAVAVACGVWTIVRTDGVTGEGRSQLKWRWTPTAEDQLLARANDLPAPAAVAPATAAAPPQPAPQMAAAPASAESGAAGATPASSATPGPASAGLPVDATYPAPMPPAPEWPGFRGPNRDDVVHGTRVATDWSASPPEELWRRPVGPGWSSFAVQGARIYTQEQRGEEEIVACYDASTGKPIWSHRDRVRFYESNGGAGPRSTPTLAGGRVYSLGATGILNALDAATGAGIWTRNASADTGVDVPGWGFAGSPLVVDDTLIVSVSGALAAYDARTGEPRWSRKSAGGGYSSPHLATIDGVAQVLLMGGGGLVSVSPKDGAELWQHAWTGTPIVQPAQIAGGDLLITTADMMGAIGIRRISVARGDGGWTVEERWTSRGLKPYFNDFVVHEGHAYGFDGSILACVGIEDGERKWKGGRYGNGQLVLLSDQDLILVVSEDGELALVSATPDRFTELARFKAIEGKTWNHPVLVHDTLLVRNGEEMVAFRLARSR